jgi:hypothetical protein
MVRKSDEPGCPILRIVPFFCHLHGKTFNTARQDAEPFFKIKQTDNLFLR